LKIIQSIFISDKKKEEADTERVSAFFNVIGGDPVLPGDAG